MSQITWINPVTGEIGPVMCSLTASILNPPQGFEPREGAFPSKQWSFDIETQGFVPKPPPVVTMDMIRQKRNQLLDGYRWTIMPDSPLSLESQAEWLSYLQGLQGLTVGLTSPEEVVWPMEPQLNYA